MTDKRTTELTEVTTPADGDLVYIVDVSDTTDSAAGSSRYAQIGSLFSVSGGNTYYVIDPLNGDDANAGGFSTPIKTFSQLNTLAPAAGSTVYVMSTAVIRESFAPTFSGTKENPITIKNYGDDLVQISCCDVETTWTKTGGQTNVYEVTQAIQTNGDTGGLVLEDTVRLAVQTSVANVDSNAGSFYHDGTKFYIHTTNSDDPNTNGSVYERSARNVGIDLPSTSEYLKVSGFEVYGASGDSTTYGNIEISGNNNELSNIKSRTAKRHVFQFLNASHCIVRDSTATDCESIAVSMFCGATASDTAVDCVMENCQILDSNGLLTIHGGDNADNLPTGCGARGCYFDANNIASTIDTSTSRALINMFATNGAFIEGCRIDGSSIGTAISPYYIGDPASNKANVGVKITNNQIEGAGIDANLRWFYIDGRSGLNDVEFTGNYFYGDNGRACIYTAASTGVNRVVVVGNKFKDVEKAFKTDANGEPNWTSDYNVMNGLTSMGDNSVGLNRTFAQWKADISQDTYSVYA